MLTPPGFYREIWESGELARVAKQCKTMRELAAHFGVTSDALIGGMSRLRGAGLAVPEMHHLLGAYMPARRPVVDRERDEWDEATSPGRPPVVEDPPDVVEEHRLRRRVRELEADNRALLDRIATAEDRFDIVQRAREMKIAPIAPRERESNGLREGTAVFLISDLHLEELVDPAKVLGLNEFTLDIARRRMERLAQGIRWFIDAQRQDFLIRDVVLWLGGDTFTGHLHPDNIESTQLAPPAAFAFSKELITGVIAHTLKDQDLERVIVPANDGNHSRLTKELRAATRTEHSLEWLMYAQLAADFRHDPRVQFEIAQGDHLYTRIYDKTIRWTHGAEIRGGAGIGGIMIPLYRAMSRWETQQHADITVAGHFHQRISLRDLEMNSSLIGFSPYAMRIGARFEEPSQSAFMMDRKRGKSVAAPIWVADSDTRAV